jgi:cytochrome c-type biogenesis protein CcmH/NrfG
MAAAAPPLSSRWLHGPVSDIALGTGLLYVPLFAALALSGTSVPAVFLPLVALAFSTPHLGATLLRVYETPESRRAYHLFAVWGTLVIAATFLVGLHVYIIGSILVTFYLTIVPWHFTGQNYGIALIFLRRCGLEVTPTLKRYIYASFLLPYVLWILALHGDQPGTAEYAPLWTAGTVYRFLSVGVPGSVQGPAVMGVAIAYVWVVAECVVRLLKLGSLRDVLPTLALMTTQSLWFAAPILSRIWITAEDMGPLAPGIAGYTFVWISTLHGVQYLWVTTYYARKERPGMRTPSYLLKALLAGSAIYGFPLLLLTPGALGRLPYDSGLYLMVAGALNVHHIMLDGVIWKLRHTRIANVLIRGAEATPVAVATPRRSWIGPWIWASGAVSVALTLAATAEDQYGVRPALETGDMKRLEIAAERLKWMGRDDAELRSRLGAMLLERGDAAGAVRELERSLALRPSAIAWLNLGVESERAGRVEDALEAYQAALALDPGDVRSLYYAGRASLRTGRVQRARELLGRAAELEPERDDIRRTLDAALVRRPPTATTPDDREG